MNFRYRLYQFMLGRYGVDELFIVLSAVSCVLAFTNCFVRSFVLQLVVYLVMLFAIFRVISRNIPARQRENKWVKGLILRFYNYRRVRLQRKADFSHIYKKCPACKAILRLPKRKGKHTTVCPKCGKQFKVRVRKGY
ncbi:MAG: hypothetical protein E7562_01260 [Ruminococcaceae bacterium]|nr:hypothetical protein [Oscillospiraceae bacterium]